MPSRIEQSSTEDKSLLESQGHASSPPLIAPDHEQLRRATAECTHTQVRLVRRRVRAHGFRARLLKPLEVMGGGILRSMRWSTNPSISRYLLVYMDKLDAMAAHIVSSQNIPERATSRAEEMALSLHYRIYVAPRVMEHLRLVDTLKQVEVGDQNKSGWSHQVRKTMTDFARSLELALKGLSSIAGLNRTSRSTTGKGNHSGLKQRLHAGPLLRAEDQQEPDEPAFVKALNQLHSDAAGDPMAEPLHETESSSDAMLAGDFGPSSDADWMSANDSEVVRNVTSASLRVRKIPPNNVVRKYKGKSDSITLSRWQLRQLIDQSVREKLRKLEPAKGEQKRPSLATNPESVEAAKPSTEATAQASAQSLYEELFPNEAKRQNELPIDDQDDDAVPRLPLPKPQQPDTLESPPDNGPRIFKNRPLKAKPDQAAVLVLYSASKSLTEDDFRRIEAPRSKTHPWATGGSFIAAIPVRDPQTLDRKSAYYLIFPSLLAARTYRERAYYLWTLAKTHASTTAGLITGAVAAPLAPDSVVDAGEDMLTLAKGFALVPPSQKLHLEILPRPYSPLIQNLMRRGGYAQIMGDHSEGREKAAKVLLKFENGMQPSRNEIDEAIGMDIRKRGVAWRFQGQDYIKQLDVERFVFDAEDTPRGEDQGRRSKTGFTTHKWILSFEDRTEATRFARQWHLKKFPWKNPVMDNGIERSTIVTTELLW